MPHRSPESSLLGVFEQGLVFRLNTWRDTLALSDKSQDVEYADVDWVTAAASAEKTFTMVDAPAARALTVSLATIDKNYAVAVAVAMQDLGNGNAASHVDFADARTSVENTWRVDVAEATGAYRLADATAESTVIGTLATSVGTPWAQFRADLAAANQSWRTGQQGALVGTASALNLAETGYRAAVGPAYLAMAATQGSALVAWTEAVNAAMVTQRIAKAAADELYQLSMAGPTEAYRIAAAQAGRDHRVALATAGLNLASGGSQQSHGDAVAAADAGRKTDQQQARNDYGSNESAASGARRIAAADADLLFSQERGDADVAWVTTTAGAYETYLIAEATAHATRVSQIAATMADAALAEADTYATAMQSLATTAPSPWATLESDRAAARRDRVAAEALASVARVGTTSDAWRDYQIARAIELKVYQIAFVESERVLASQTATAAHDLATSEANAETALALTGNYAGTLPESLGTLTSSLSTPAASSEHYSQLTGAGGIGPEGGTVFAPPAPQPRLGGDQLDISKFNPTDPNQDRDNLAYVEMTRRWMETQGDRADQYAEFREQQERQASGDSSWLYEAKQRGKQQALADVKRQNRRSTWGFVFNLRGIVPAGSQADNYLGAAEEAVAAAQLQGQLNIVNGLTNILVEGFNTSMYVMMGIPTIALTNLANTAAGEAVLPTEFPQIPVIDYSQDAFVFEDPYWHGWSVWCGGTGITMLLPGGIAKQAGPALKGSSIGRMFTGVSKTQTGTVEAVVSQAKSLTPKSLGKVRLARATARATPVAEAIGGAPARVAPNSTAGLTQRAPTWDAYPASLSERLAAYKQWKASAGVRGKPTQAEFRRFVGAHRPNSRGSTLYFEDGDFAAWSQRVGSTHGNTAGAQMAWLYRLESDTGEFLKWGISQDPFTRYSGPFMRDKVIIPFRSGPRNSILQFERDLVERMPGPLNFEPWAGSRLGQ